ncbi:hypothetical protein CFN78_21230 [Amycolatopsis antarctica]|uniref:CAAX prenyl protease 2/Lysostaphin resistance protein A-like domain-containing protein n=1 Tax=Amycolatopsis antarctica TaxID=1854586 RepID=A0A263CYS9_9PSEU|nr:CPBP family glutamic-type intramembrane protease [Amycolatopsis antarctica]OZM71314.1 hypothetical protein CFN78_21230 [Amycolatopsis antarctica]
MTATTDLTAPRARTGTAIGRALLAAAVMATGLGAGTGLGAALAAATGLDGALGRLLPAVLCCALVVPAVLLLRTRRDRLTVTGIGLTAPRSAMSGFALGVAVTLGSAVAVLGAGTAAGWLRWGPVAPATLLAFVLVNGLTALLLEALPEEVSLRGYAWTSMRERHRALLATTVTTALFLVVPGASTVVHAGVTSVLGGEPSVVGIVPAGEDPVSYLVLLLVFGLTLVAARTATPSRSLWTCVGTHLAFLTVNRVTFFGGQREAGWSTEPATPDVVLLVPAYLVLAALAYLLIARLRRPT